MVDIGDLDSRLTLDSAASHLPMWTDWGVKDSGHLIHSLGCTFLTAAGRDSGFAAVSEVPAPRDRVLPSVMEDVRSDSVWFDRETQRATLIAEFERYAGKQKDLSPKAASLLLAQHRWGYENATLLLAYWSIGLVTVPDHDKLGDIVGKGFTATGGIRVSGNPRARLIFFQFVMKAGRDGMLRLERILRRGDA